MIVVPIPEIKNQTLTPIRSAIGEPIKRPNGIESEATNAMREKALPIFSAGMVVCIYATKGILWTFPKAPIIPHTRAKINHAHISGGNIPSIVEVKPIPSNPK